MPVSHEHSCLVVAPELLCAGGRSCELLGSTVQWRSAVMFAFNIQGRMRDWYMSLRSLAVQLCLKLF